MPSAHAGGGLVRYCGCFFGVSGYDLEAQTVAIYLSRRGYRLRLVPFGRRNDRLGLLELRTRRLLECLVQRLPGTGEDQPPVVEIHHLPPPFMRLDSPVPAKIGRSMFETERLPADWAGIFRNLDALWVPSRFNAEACVSAGIEESRVKVVPIGVETGVFRPGPRGAGFADENVGADDGAGDLWMRRSDTVVMGGWRPGMFRFLSVFAWQARKGWDILTRAYLEEFGPREEVCLVVKTRTPKAAPGTIFRELISHIRDTLRRSPDQGPPVVLLPGHMRKYELAVLYRSCDAFVLPSRGEGFGRPYLEAMATGLPTIGTAWSGNLDFMTPENSYLIQVEALDPVDSPDLPDAFHGQRWARPSVEHLRLLMRRVYENRQEAAARGRVARESVVRRYSVGETCSGLARELDKYLL